MLCCFIIYARQTTLQIDWLKSVQLYGLASDSDSSDFIGSSDVTINHKPMKPSCFFPMKPSYFFPSVCLCKSESAVTQLMGYSYNQILQDQICFFSHSALVSAAALTAATCLSPLGGILTLRLLRWLAVEQRKNSV